MSVGYNERAWEMLGASETGASHGRRQSHFCDDMIHTDSQASNDLSSKATYFYVDILAVN